MRTSGVEAASACADSFSESPLGLRFWRRAYGLFDVDGWVYVWISDCVTWSSRPKSLKSAACLSNAACVSGGVLLDSAACLSSAACVSCGVLNAARS